MAGTAQLIASGAGRYEKVIVFLRAVPPLAAFAPGVDHGVDAVPAPRPVEADRMALRALCGLFHPYGTFHLSAHDVPSTSDLRSRVLQVKELVARRLGGSQQRRGDHPVAPGADDGVGGEHALGAETLADAFDGPGQLVGVACIVGRGQPLKFGAKHA